MLELTADEKQIDAQETAHSRDARPWLQALSDAEKVFQKWQDCAKSIERIYANLEVMASDHADRELQIFWANMEVLRPIVYSREPVPVVRPRFKDRRPLLRKASEVLERALISDFELDDVDTTMRLVRDDLLLIGRGVGWVRYGERDAGEAAIFEHIDREDFLHAPARKWAEVPWVARAAYLTRQEGFQRFGDYFLKAQFLERDIGGEEGDSTGEKTAKVWEIWHKHQRVVCWVSEGMEEVLDIQPPEVDLKGFFPCPRPALATLQPRTLIALPDFLYYKDQLEEINEQTARIGALQLALRVRGFYNAGAREVGDAIETALADLDDRRVMIPLSNVGALGGEALKDALVWMPIEIIASTIEKCIALRTQLISDVYEVTGLSDIMRGQTAPSETARAQTMKGQYGSIRLQSKQSELVRIARDVTRLKAEIMAEKLHPATIFEMSQVDDLPHAAQIQQQIAQLFPAAQQDPAAAKQIEKLQQEVTVEAVAALFREQRIRPFALEIETNSTIQPDEDAEKQRRTELLQAVGAFLSQALEVVSQMPWAAPFVMELLKFVTGAYRAGRDLAEPIDELSEMVKAMLEAQREQPPQPDPAQLEIAMKREMAAADIEIKRQEMAAKIALEREKAGLDAQLRADRDASDAALAAEKAGADIAIKQNAEAARAQIAQNAARARGGV